MSHGSEPSCSELVWQAQGDPVIVTPGQLDDTTAVLLRHLLAKLLDEHREFIVDLGGVTTLDRTGLGVLAGAVVGIEERKGWLRVVCSAGPAYESLSGTALGRILPPYPSIAAARAGAAR